MPGAPYDEPNTVWSLTTSAKQRRRVFENHELAAAAVNILRSHADARGVVLHAFCVMPDHVHVVMSPTKETPVRWFDWPHSWSRYDERPHGGAAGSEA